MYNKNMKKLLNSKNRHFIYIFGYFILLYFVWKYTNDLPQDTYYKKIMIMITFLTYIFSLVYWIISIRNRVVHRIEKSYLISIGCVMIVTIVIRSIKWQIDLNYEVTTILWYLYYLSFIYIPLFSFLCAYYLNHKNINKVRWLYIPAVLLLIMILTNNYHQFVFSFYDGIQNYNNFHHEIGYYLIFAWTIILEVLFVYSIGKKSRNVGSKKKIVYPYIVLVVGALYFILYNNGIYFYRDMMMVTNFLIIWLFEACIYSNLILVNTNYKDFFYQSDESIYILDSNNKVRYQNGEVIHQEDENKIYHEKDIIGGKVIYVQDTTDINSKIHELEELKNQIEYTTIPIQIKLDVESKRVQIEEKNRIYQLCMDHSYAYLDELEALLMDYKESKDNHMLPDIYSLGVFIKRYMNLIVVSEMNDSIDYKELEHSILDYMHTYNKHFYVLCNYQGSYSKNKALRIFEFIRYISTHLTYDSMYILLSENVAVRLIYKDKIDSFMDDAMKKEFIKEKEEIYTEIEDEQTLYISFHMKGGNEDA